MNKQQIIERIELLSRGLSTYTIQKVKEDDKEKVIENLERNIEKLNILIYEIRRY